MTIRPERIEDSPDLLRAMLTDMEGQDPIYQPGPYWRSTAMAAATEIVEHGLNDFRGSSNLIGMSYADPLIIDWRLHMRTGILKRFFRWLTTHLYPLNKIYENQVDLTRSNALQSLIYAQELLRLKSRTSTLLQKYKVPYSLLGGCLQKVIIEENEISLHYLSLLSQHDYAAEVADFRSGRSLLEIGGGFGANVHLVLTNYPNVRKIIYLDIPPNLYVGTQYLRAFYGSSVADYQEIKRRNAVKFLDDDSLEILCIAPWQIEMLDDEVDVFFNSHSFVEMPKEVVKNYAHKAVVRFSSQKTDVVLVSYTTGDMSTTFNPDALPDYFSSRNNFVRFKREDLLLSATKVAFSISAGIR